MNKCQSILYKFLETNILPAKPMYKDNTRADYSISTISRLTGWIFVIAETKELISNTWKGVNRWPLVTLVLWPVVILVVWSNPFYCHHWVGIKVIFFRLTELCSVILEGLVFNRAPPLFFFSTKAEFWFDKTGHFPVVWQMQKTIYRTEFKHLMWNAKIWKIQTLENIKRLLWLSKKF